MTRIVSASEDAIKEAVEILRSGGIVAMPTETVYGLAANALDGQAVARVYEAKGRPAFNPLIAHFVDMEAAAEHAVFDERAKAVAQAFWPGPLTLVLKRIVPPHDSFSPNSNPLPGGERGFKSISELATAGLETLAVRVPDHKVARALLEEMGGPLVAPSANKSGSLSPTTPAMVADSLGAAVDMILAAGPCKIGLESTVLDLSEDVPVILRPGAVTAEAIGEVLGCDIILHNAILEKGDGRGSAADGDGGERPKAPGMLLKHYAPETPLRLNAIDLKAGEALLAFGSDRFMGIEGGGAAKDLPENMRRNLSAEGDLHEAAANLFAMLKELDRAGAKRIAVMAVPETGLGVAINDRLRRAAEG